MIKVVVCSNTGKQEIMIDINSTPRQAFEQAGMTYASGMATINGRALSATEIDKPFAELDVGDMCYLVVASKHDNA